MNQWPACLHQRPQSTQPPLTPSPLPPPLLLRYVKAAKVADALSKELHYTVDEKQKSVLLTEDGYEAVEDVLQVTDLYDPRTQWASFIINALKVGPRSHVVA